MATPAEHQQSISDAMEKHGKWRDTAHSFAIHGTGSLASFYDTSAEEYTQIQLKVGYYGHVNLAFIVADVISDESARILDAASGTGMVGEELKVRGFTCIDALDPSRDSLDKSKEHQAYTEYICDTMDEHQTQIADNQYDAVVMGGTFGILGHVTEACFPELIRVTKPGGYIMFTLSGKILQKWEDKLDAAIQAMSQQGLWELVEYRWMPYLVNEAVNEKAKVPILRFK